MRELIYVVTFSQSGSVIGWLVLSVYESSAVIGCAYDKWADPLRGGVCCDWSQWSGAKATLLHVLRDGSAVSDIHYLAARQQTSTFT